MYTVLMHRIKENSGSWNTYYIYFEKNRNCDTKKNILDYCDLYNEDKEIRIFKFSCEIREKE